MEDLYFLPAPVSQKSNEFESIVVNKSLLPHLRSNAGFPKKKRKNA